MTAEFYADQYRRYQTYVRSFGDEPIYKIACGAADGDYHWTEVLMRAARGRGGRLLMDGLSLHYYTFGGVRRPHLSATDFDESEWFEVLQARSHA
jgi:alpha-N-arabinofuranosidase